MKHVQYTGSAGIAAITDQHFDALGLSDRSLVWRGNGDTQEVSDEAADHLAKNDGSRFVIVEQDEDDDS